MSEKNIGKCACGNVEYSFTGSPVNSAFCYCNECQIHTGTDKYFGIWVENDKFKLNKGEPGVFVRKGDSGKNVNHHFCKDCGTNLYIDVTVANIISIAASTLGNGHQLKPNMAIYTASAPSWAIFPEGVPRFEKLPTNS